MKMTKTTVALYKGFAFIPSSTTKNENRNLAMTVQANLMQYGYLLSDEAFQFLANADRASIINFNDECITYLKDMMGGRYDYQPMYKNFPEEVMSMSDCELFWNQIIHYLSNGEWMPESIEMERPVKFENIKYTVLESISQRRFMQIFTDLCSINTSLTPVDRAIVEWFCKEYDELIFPDIIPFKETLCLVISALYKSGKELEFV